MKIVINRCYGGFSISQEACKRLRHNEFYYCLYSKRTDKKLIALIEELGAEACSGKYAELEVVEIPDNVKDWYIMEYDGMESIHEGRVWP